MGVVWISKIIGRLGCFIPVIRIASLVSIINCVLMSQSRKIPTCPRLNPVCRCQGFQAMGNSQDWYTEPA